MYEDLKLKGLGGVLTLLIVDAITMTVLFVVTYFVLQYTLGYSILLSALIVLMIEHKSKLSEIYNREEHNA